MSEDRDRNALLVLEDGTYFEGRAAGADEVAVGEVVFNTSMSGYQEILTDPSYSGQLVTLTVPHVGNYGVTEQDLESDGIKAAGLIVRGLSDRPSNYRSQQSLPDWLEEEGVAAISEIDTRAVTRRVRDEGVMMGLIAPGATAAEVDRWLEELESHPDYGSQDFVSEVVCDEPRSVEIRTLEEEEGVQGDPAQGEVEFGPARAEVEDDFRPHIVVVDYGVKFSILRHLHRQGFRLSLVPPDVEFDVLRSLEPDGILLSNGPGDPAQLDDRLNLVERIVEEYPTFGICMGQQLLGRAMGAETFKLPYGHRGPNQPVREEESGHVAMTSQNHGYAVEADSLPDEIEITHMNLNDDTVAGFQHRELPVFAVQYHPEAGPGPHDAIDFFDEFAETVREASS